jgi:hypothetical protein
VSAWLIWMPVVIIGLAALCPLVQLAVMAWWEARDAIWRRRNRNYEA